MYTIMDYLDWRGDLSFTASEVNEIDGLIFSEIMYTEMDDIFREGITLAELAGAYEREKIDQTDFIYDPAPLLMKAAATERFGQLRLYSYVNRIDPEQTMQFSAVVFMYDDLHRYIVFRGTDSTITGWREDLNLALINATPGQEAARMYLEENAGTSGEIYIGGHSKGGNLAYYAAATCRRDIYERITRIHSFDGPGFPDDSPVLEILRDTAVKTQHFIPESSLVGILMESPGIRILVRSSAISYLQHNPYTWSVEFTHFERTENQTSFASYTENVMDRWLTELDPESRGDFIDTVFDALEKTGIKTLQDIQQNPVKTLFGFFEEINRADSDMKKNISDVLKQLTSTGAEEFRDALGILRKKES